MKPGFVSAPLTLSGGYAKTNFLTSRHVASRAFATRTRSAPKMLVVEVGSVSQMDTVLDSAGENLVIVDYSTSWCGPCKVIAPVFEEMSDKFKDVVFVKVMGDSTPDAGELMKREGIRAVPAFHFWKEKKKVLDFTGAKVASLEEGIAEFG